MWHQLAQPLKITACVLIIGGAAVGVGLAEGSRLTTALAGAAMGAIMTLAAALHLVIRTADGRGIAARSLEAHSDSVETQIWRDAASRACVDGISVGALVALLCLWSPGSTLTQWLPLLAVVGIGADLGIRVWRGWRKKFGAHA